MDFRKDVAGIIPLFSWSSQCMNSDKHHGFSICVVDLPVLDVECWRTENFGLLFLKTLTLINLETGCLEAIVDLQIVACKN